MAILGTSLLLLLPSIFLSSAFPVVVTYDVVRLGAKPDGKTDSTQAFQTAWTNACASTKPSSINVPRGRYYLRTATFNGPCKNNAIFIRIDGSLVAPSDFQVIGNSAKWIMFRQVNGVTISGGILDGRGTALWACKNSSCTSCPSGATMFHIVINEYQNVKIKGLKVFTPRNSSNTDGIHIQQSSAVSILNSKIGTGDDCISIGPGTSNLWIENVVCGPGHGISIGSLGKDLEEAGVQNVTVKTAVFSGTQNGVRIKAWGRPSNGFANNILFQHIVMANVQNPILIDQNYVPATGSAHQLLLAMVGFCMSGLALYFL